MSSNHILLKAQALYPKLIQIYEQLHKIPELAFEEFKTAELLSQILVNEGFSKVRTAIAGTGLEVSIGNGSPIVALRADMDALPIQEETGFAFSSVHDGQMHACGHDAHMTTLIGAGMLLKDALKEKQAGVKLIFQPAEESPPGGAKGMVEAGVLNQELKAIFALHCQPQYPAEVICLKDGPIMAAADMFTIEINGQGGHGAMPHQTMDAVVIGSQIVQELQTIVSRRVDPLEPAVVTVGSFHAGSKNNIIPGKAKLEGTVRTLNSQIRNDMPALMEKIISNVCASYDADYLFNYQWGYPPVVNDSNLLKVVERAAHKIVGHNQTLYADRPSMGGEDFSYYLEKVPGVFFYLGVGHENANLRHPWHHPCFQIDTAALPIGAATLAQAALEVIGG